MIKKVSKNVNGLNGEIVIPSDKSISHRAVMLASLVKGRSIIKNFSNGQDPNSTMKIFKALGVNCKFTSDNELEIVSEGILKAPEKDLYCGNSGTTMRLVSGILAGQNFNCTLTGDESLSKRPMKRIIEPLKLMGADISSVDNHAPLKIRGKKLCGINYISPIASAQVKSCILLAGLNAEEITSVTEPFISRNHTELMLKYMGADINIDGNYTTIKKSVLEPKEISVCGDISSAAYFIVAGLLVPNSKIILKNVGLNPTRTGILKVAAMMGAEIEILDKRELCGELTGDLKITSTELKSCKISGELIPQLIDEIPIIAVMATQADGDTVICDAKDLRNKESDRIKTTISELKKLGADIDELDDGMIIHGKTQLKGNCDVETYSDHRLAMCLYVSGLICDKEITINGFEWAGISFPEFDNLFNKLQK